ncbi:tetratricopeptide repeat protein [Sphingomonas glaciei]|uniref:DUF1570 domain-containing protein n=1 Tax=Sphingomonas glaciei TaxID=2938948 RepID=A0ABY5MVW3_9SPHN|nr:hypothetical protein [Sphingomonas glaciei]UUR08393.1 hypothetical protein M1K48_01735 [Sphingomonas glaciei]
MPFRLFIAVAVALFAGSPAVAAWHEARTKHFIIYSEQRPAELKSYAERLERFDAAVRKVRGYADPPLTDGARLTIFDLPSVAAVRKLLPRQMNAAGFYIPRASGAVAFVSRKDLAAGQTLDSDQLLQHEYTHHLMLTDPNSPLAAWLVEGTAEFFGTAVVEKNGNVKIGFPPQGRQTTILRDLGFSAGDLLSGARARTDMERSSIYAKGWLLTHYLAFNQARSGQLSRYLDGLARGEPAATAAQTAFGDLKQLDREIDLYATKTFPALEVPAGAPEAVAIRPLTPGESAILPVRIRVDRGLRPADVEGVAAQAREIAGSHPEDPAVQAALAEVELSARRYWPAITAADKALARDPKNIGAMITKGRALLDEARGKGGSADYTEVRRWLIRANRADTENAEPLYLFYQSFVVAGQKPTPDAIKGLYYAHLLAPHDMGLRFNVVRQRLTDGEIPAALRSFAPIVANPHIDIEKRPKLLEALQKMQARDAAGALAAIEEDYRAGRGRSTD